VPSSLAILRSRALGRASTSIALRAAALTASLFAVTFARPASVSAQACAACEQAPTEGLPSQEPQSLQIALDAWGAASGGSDNLLGAGGALRVGEVFPYMGASIIPEVGFQFFGFGGDTPGDIFGGFAGGRIRFGRGIVPGVYGHVGVAGVRWRDDYAAPTADFGLSVDATFIPKVLFAMQGGYSSTVSTGGNPAMHWFSAGFTMGLRL
jgi:hypothetical protein